MNNVVCDNPILRTDAYKLTHWRQYPKGTQIVHSYLESRGGVYPQTCFFGLQMILDRYLSGPVVTQEHINEAIEFSKGLFGTTDYLNIEGWKHIVDVHGGYLPLRIKAVPEGMVVPVSNVLMTVENTDPAVPWLTNLIETTLMKVWYPITVATLSREIRKTIDYYSEVTGSKTSICHLNDFGYRGVSSEESAGIGGAAHLVNFNGTDTLAGIWAARKHYGSCNGYSVAATEHSTTTIYGERNELSAYEGFIREFPSGYLSVVADSYNIDGALAMFTGPLRDKILQRSGAFVVRPDSGHPPDMVVKCLEKLDSGFGSTRNEKGYLVLDPHVRIIYGDGMNHETVKELFHAVYKAGFATENVVIGMGGALLQDVTRDTQKFAFKCSAARINGEWVDVFKRPASDQSKSSKRGLMKLVRLSTPDGPKYATVGLNHPADDCMVKVFEDGAITKRWTFEEIRERAKESD